MINRRKFLHSAALSTAFGFGVAGTGWMGTSARGALRTGTHGLRTTAQRGIRLPAIGLFFDAENMDEVRARFAEDPMFATLRDRLRSIDRAEARETLRNDIRYNDHLYDIATVSRMAEDLAFLYTMTGDEDAGRLAIEAVETIMRFPKWDYFLEAGEQVIGLQRAPGATLAVAQAADWLGDAVDDEARRTWMRTMGERGCEPSYLSIYGMRHPDRVEGWTIDETSTYFEHRPDERFDLTNWPIILDDTNLKAVPAAALAIGALSYREVLGSDENTDRWLEQAIYSMGTFRDLYAPDGSYPEGVPYAEYTSTHLAMATEALQRMDVTDLFDVINWIGYGAFLREMTVPTYDAPRAVINFGDGGGGARSAVSFWTASRAFDARSQWFGQQLAREHSIYSVVWYDPQIEPSAPSDRPHLWINDLDWVVARTGYEPEDVVVAMRSGGPANHEQADRNSIIVKAFGERLVADPYGAPYNSADPAWMMRTTAGHSALLIDGDGHQYHDGEEGTNASQAAASVVRSGERDGYLFWTSDATPAYRLVMPDVRSVTRTVIVLYELPAIIVADKVLKNETPSIIQARFFADNTDGRTTLETARPAFRTIRPNARLNGHAASPGGVAVRTGRLPIPEETASRYPFVEAATGTESLHPYLVTVLAPTPGDQNRVELSIDESAEGVTQIRLATANGEGTCTLHDTGAIPEFELLL